MDRPIIHPAGTFHPMSAVAYHDETRAMLARLEDKERRRSPDTVTARQRLARRLGALPGTIENFARGRIKRADAYLRARIEALLMTELQQEIAALTHELEKLRASGSDPRLSAIAEVETALATARELLTRKDI
jgi:hypothetical protein